jgi:RNAse (barnase) inhibitor barstar
MNDKSKISEHLRAVDRLLDIIHSDHIKYSEAKRALEREYSHAMKLKNSAHTNNLDTLWVFFTGMIEAYKSALNILSESKKEGGNPC